MRQYQSEAINDLAAALAKAQAKMDPAKKNAKNPAYKRGNKESTYADLPDVVEAAKAHLCENGLSVIHVPDVNEQGEPVLMVQLMHSSGQWIRGWYPIKPTKIDPQGVGSAITYARRYSYCAITGVVAEDEDDDGNAASGKTIKEECLFSSPEERQKFIDGHLATLGKAQVVKDARDVYELNQAKLLAMKDSKDPADVSAYQLFVTNYNAKVKSLKGAKPTAVANTVEAAMKAQSPVGALADDEIPF